MRKQTYSRTSPKSGRRATLGANGKYSRKNDKGFMINQGIGNLEGQGNSTVTNTLNERTLIEVSSRNEFVPIVNTIAVNELASNSDGWISSDNEAAVYYAGSGYYWDGAPDGESISKTFNDILIGETYTIDFELTPDLYAVGYVKVSGIFDGQTPPSSGTYSFTGIAQSNNVVLTGLDSGFTELEVSKININRVI
tara:strand:+ start:1304 stop:1888 length:585 start_codon:yes stop_codon:yes gene_type:complete